jgi:hypothetical protein
LNRLQTSESIVIPHVIDTENSKLSKIFKIRLIHTTRIHTILALTAHTRRTAGERCVMEGNEYLKNRGILFRGKALR